MSDVAEVFFDDESGIDEITAEAYAAYSEAVGGLTWDGRPMPTYAELPDKQHGGWIAAIKKALEVCDEVEEADEDFEDTDEDDGE